MKKILLLVAGISILLPSLAFAGSGKTLIPHFLTDSTSKFYSFFYLSNITDESIEVSVIFYDKSGNIIHDNNSATTGNVTATDVTNYVEPTTDSTVTVTILPHTTSTISLRNTLSNPGYGEIEWQQNNSSRRLGMVAQGRILRQSGSYEHGYAITINSGNAF